MQNDSQTPAAKQTCPDCNEEYDSQEAACPRCTVPEQEEQGRGGGRRALLPVAVFAVSFILVLAGLYDLNESARKTQVTPPEVPSAGENIPAVTSQQADKAARNAIRDLKERLETSFFRLERYPVIAHEYFDLTRNRGSFSVPNIYISEGPEFYQLLAFHPSGNVVYLVRAGEPDIREFPQQDVIETLKQKYGPQAMSQQDNNYYIQADSR